jgi:phage-related baseplate assembly protein
MMANLFNETDAEKIVTNILTRLQEDVSETLYPGDERRMFAQAAASLLVTCYNTMEDNARQSLLRYARNNVLDLIGETYGCTRLAEHKATTTLRFSATSTAESDITVPAGTRASNEAGLTFVTNEDAIIPTGSTYIDTLATAEAGGILYNNLLIGTINVLIDSVPYISSVTNTVITKNGTDKEKDENYRERIRLALSAISTAGGKASYIYWAKSVSTDISDVFLPEPPTPNTIQIYIAKKDGQIPDAALIQQVYDAVTADDVKPMGDLVTVSAPSVSMYDIDIKYYVSSKNATEAIKAIEDSEYVLTNGDKIKGAIEQYRLWQDSTIGRDINPDKLISLLMSPAGDHSVPGAERIEITAPEYLRLNGPEIAHFSGTLHVVHEIYDDEGEI